MTWQVHSNMTREVAQTLQEARKMARSIDNTAASLAPLTTEVERQQLSQISSKAQEIALMITDLYNGIAPQAFGPESGK